MKKYFLILFCIVLISNTNAQIIQWGPTQEVEESFTNYQRSKSGCYLGNVGEYEFYAYYQYRNSFYFDEYVQFAFLKVKNNEVIAFSPYSERGYRFHEILLIEDQIAIIYSLNESKENMAVKVEYFKTSDLSYNKTEILFTYPPAKNSIQLTRMSRSEDNNTLGFFTVTENPDSEEVAFLIKTFSMNLEEKMEKYIPLDLEETNNLNSFKINNDGTGYVVYSQYEIKEKTTPRLNKIKILKFNAKSEKTVEFSEEKMEEPQDLDVIQINDQKAKLILTSASRINIYDLDFVREDYSDFQTFDVKKGNWEFDKILRLDNGSYFIAIANKGLYSYRSSSAIINVYYNKSIRFYCFDKDFNYLTYSTSVGRYYNITENYQSPRGYLSVSPVYHQSNNKVTLVYNSDVNYPKKLAEKNGDDNSSITNITSKNCNYQKTTISEDGKIITQTITQSKIEKGLLIPSFCHFTDSGIFRIVKIKNYNITFGSIEL